MYTNMVMKLKFNDQPTLFGRLAFLLTCTNLVNQFQCDRLLSGIIIQDGIQFYFIFYWILTCKTWIKSHRSQLGWHLRLSQSNSACLFIKKIKIWSTWKEDNSHPEETRITTIKKIHNWTSPILANCSERKVGMHHKKPCELIPKLANLSTHWFPSLKMWEVTKSI